MKLAALAGLGVLAAVALAPSPAGGAHAREALVTIQPTVIAQFYSLGVSVSGSGSVTSDPSGIDCGSTCSALYARGTSVTLTARPSSAIYAFTGWSGDGCSGTGTCTVTGGGTVTASFGLRTIVTGPIVTGPILTGPILTTPTISLPSTYSLTVLATGSGSVSSSPSGLACAITCTAAFALGTSVTIHATPSSGYVISGWSGGGCTGTGSTCTVTAGGTVNVTFTLAASATTTTSTSTSPAASTPTTTSSSNQPVIVSTPTTSTPAAPLLVAVTVGVLGSGTVTGKASLTGKSSGASVAIACGAHGSACFGKYVPGATITLHATPVAGFRFSNWTGGCSGKTPTCRIVAAKASTVSAHFAPQPSAAIDPVVIDTAAFSVSWNQSVGTGKLLVHGRIAKGAQVDIQLARSGGGNLVSEKLQLPAGAFSLGLKLDPALGLIPGGFVVTISGKSGNLSVPPQVKTLSLASPRGGVVGHAFASASASGGPTGTLHASSKQAFVTFDFLSPPPSGQALTVAWFEPGGKLLGSAPKSSAPVVTSSIKSNAPLPRGAWHVDLRSGKTVVKRVTINVK